MAHRAALLALLATLVGGAATAATADHGNGPDFPSSHAVEADPGCRDVTAGILAGNTCCALSCGTCGGPGCDARPGGAAACCSRAIQRAGRSCQRNPAPCAVTGPPPPDGFNVTVPTNFVGFSIEVPQALDMLSDAARGPKLAYANLLWNLYNFSAGAFPAAPGPVLRIGGNSADESCYAEAVRSPRCKYEITRGDLEAYRAFARVAPNVSFVLDTNLGASSAYTVFNTCEHRSERGRRVSHVEAQTHGDKKNARMKPIK